MPLEAIASRPIASYVGEETKTCLTTTLLLPFLGLLVVLPFTEPRLICVSFLLPHHPALQMLVLTVPVSQFFCQHPCLQQPCRPHTETV